MAGSLILDRAALDFFSKFSMVLSLKVGPFLLDLVAQLSSFSLELVLAWKEHVFASVPPLEGPGFGNGSSSSSTKSTVSKRPSSSSSKSIFCHSRMLLFGSLLMLSFYLFWADKIEFVILWLS